MAKQRRTLQFIPCCRRCFYFPSSSFLWIGEHYELCLCILLNMYVAVAVFSQKCLCLLALALAFLPILYVHHRTPFPFLPSLPPSPLLLPPLPPLPSPSILSSHFPLGSPTSTPPRSDRPANNHPSTHTHLSTCPLKNAMEGREASGHPNHITGAYVEGGGGAEGERPATQAFFYSSTSSRVRP